MVIHTLLQFQTTAPKSCFMRPPSGVLAPNATVIATGTVQSKSCKAATGALWFESLQCCFNYTRFSIVDSKIP